MDEICRTFVRGGLKNKIPSSAENRILTLHVVTIYFIDSLCGCIRNYIIILLLKDSRIESVCVCTAGQNTA